MECITFAWKSLTNKGKHRSLAFGRPHAQIHDQGRFGRDSASGTQAIICERGKIALKVSKAIIKNI